jgi:uncharacterized protein YwbE
MEPHRNRKQRGSGRIWFIVDIIRKEDQRHGKKTRGDRSGDPDKLAFSSAWD